MHGLAVKLCAVPSDLGGGNELYKDEGAAISKASFLMFVISVPHLCLVFRTQIGGGTGHAR